MCRGFLDVGKLAMKKLVEGMFLDPGMADLLKKLYQGAEWAEGRVTATFTATLEDYFTDCAEFLDSSISRRVIELTLEHSIASYTGGLMSKLMPITEEVIGRMEKDEDEVCDPNLQLASLHLSKNYSHDRESRVLPPDKSFLQKPDERGEG